MTFLTLDATKLHSACLIACEFIIHHRDELNAINVFPVADGDTGDNMASTALSIIQNSSPKPSITDTLRSLANAATLGARGNSGMIFSQFFNGLTEVESLPEQIDTQHFARLLIQASHSVRQAILHPIEGTIITVIDAWAKNTENLAKKISNFQELLTQSLIAANTALQSTATTLAVLKEAHVVDAGALGFYHFIQGFAQYLENPRQLDVTHMHFDSVEPHHDLPSSDTPPNERYCTEIMLTGESIDRDQITHHLEQFGDCIVSSGNASLCRFHLHCTHPHHVFESLLNQGTISQSKAQDMMRQFQMVHQTKFPIALVTDSSADIPQHLLDDHQIHIIQLNMQLDNHHLLDRICINPETFYERLTTLKTYPKTSFPSPGIIEEQIKHIAAHYPQVLILPIAQALSGTHDAIVKATQNFSNVHVVDSKSTSGGLGLLVLYAGQLIASGHSIDDIKQKLLVKISKTHFYVYVHQFESLIRSGRISKIGGRIAQFAHVKPIITLNEQGKGTIYDKAFSETKALSKLIGFVDTLCRTEQLETYAIVHAGAPEKAQDFAELTQEAFGYAPAFIEPVSTAIGLHAGKGCVGLVAMMS